MSDNARFDEEQSTLRRARVLSLPYIDTSQISDKKLYQLLTVAELRSLKVIPLFADEHRIDFGITNTTSQRTLEDLKKRFLDQQISYSMISDTGYSDYMRLYDPPKKIEYADIEISSADPEQLLAEVSRTLSQVKADDMLAYLVQQSFRLQASDIHLESREAGARIRLRVHGVLHSVATLDQDKYRQLISALASAANVSTSSDDDQTGHINKSFRMATGESVTVNVRVETVPAINGMDAVLRLFNFRSDMMRLDKLGLSDYQQHVIGDIISHPTGLVLIVGPTGSGKTTTLYSILNELNTDNRKIITLEDPVEYQIEGISQIPVKSRKGQSFADKFRAVLRLDPDVIMVGEIRDNDTAKTALQAALTGHLVLSTYHASSASAALTRLLDAIGENPLYASAIKLIQAQRLVRRLDPSSKKPLHPTAEQQAYIQKVLSSISKHANIDLSGAEQAVLYEPGATAKNPFGYDGQFAIRELMQMTPELRALLSVNAANLSTEQIEQAAVNGGMLTMEQEGMLRVLNGDTTLSEISRVIG